MTKCSKSKDGVHVLPNVIPMDRDSFIEWNKLSYLEKIKSQYCMLCGEAIW
jgi:hypothetical protein